jgi:hypothetical protein
MFDNKTIIFVSPEMYSDIARVAVHELSKIENIEATFWTINYFKGAEHNKSDDNFYVFIGNEEENELSKSYLPIFNEKFPRNKSGYYYDINGKKAIAFGVGDLTQLEAFETTYKRIKKENLKLKEKKII